MSDEVTGITLKYNFELSKPEDVEGVLCETVLIEEVEEYTLMAEEMINFCLEKGGIGLAAVQIGIPKRFFVWQFKEGLFQMAFNPEFFVGGSKVINTIESCLTYGTENKYFLRRYKTIRFVYDAYDVQKKEFLRIKRNARGEEAIVLQHEVEHLNGESIATKGKLIEEK